LSAALQRRGARLNAIVSLMSPRLKSAIQVFAALTIVAVTGLLAYLGLRGLWRTLIGVNPTLAVGVVAAAATLLGSTITVMLGRYLERKKEIEAHFRSEKIKIYDEFLAELFKVFQSEGQAPDDELVKFLRVWQRKLVLWGGSNVLVTYFKWMNRLKLGAPDAHALFLMDDFFRALRSDIGQSSAGLVRGAFANLILRHGDFFLAQAARNPNITLEELAALEKQYFGEK
jgi:hypothetical protein